MACVRTTGGRRAGRVAGPGSLVACLLGGLWACPAGFLAGCGRDDGAARPIEVVAKLGETGRNPGQLAYPRCIESDSKGLWVIDKQARVQRLDPTTGRAGVFWTMPEFALGKPTGVTVWRALGAPGVLVFVADTHYHRVMVYDVPDAMGEGTPRLVTQFGSFGTGAGEFIYPTDIAVVSSADGSRIERLYVSEYGGNDRVSVYEPTGADGFAFRSSFGRYGNGPEEFNRPQSIVWDAVRGELIVADACNHRLGRFTGEGKNVGWMGGGESVGSEAGRFNYPYGICQLPDGTLLVSEYGNSRVQRVDVRAGTSLGIFGTRGRGKGQLATPWGVALAGETAYVLDSGNDRILGFEVPASALRARIAGGGGR